MNDDEIKIKAFEEYNRGEYWVAIVECMRAMVLNPIQPWIYYLLGLSYFSLDMYQQSLPCFYRFLSFSPDDPESVSISKNRIELMQENV